MKIKHVFTTFGLAIAAIGIGAGFAGKGQVKEAKAATYEGSIHLSFEGVTNWTNDNAKVCIYLWNDNGGGEGEKTEGWSSIQSIGSTKEFDLTYSFQWQPAKMIVTRQNGSAAAGSWNTKWNQTGDLVYSEYVILSDAYDPVTTVGVQVRSSTVADFGRKQWLTKVGTGSDSHKEVSGKVTLAENEEFKILNDEDGLWSGYYGCPSAIDSCFTGGSKVERSNDNPNIKCLVAGTYDFYFDTVTHRVWLTRQDIVDADGYASYFLSHVGCDASGVNSPSGWTDVAEHFATLSNDAKKFLCQAIGSIEEGADNIARCVFWYDRALVQHPSLEGFMSYTNDLSQTVSRSATVSSYAQNNANNNSVLLIAMISCLTLVALGGYFLLKKKKEN